LVITDAGEELIAKMVAGTSTATFTKVGISPRDYSGVQTEKLTDIEDVRQSTLVSNVVRTDGSKVEVLAAFENKDVTEGYYVRTVGIWAEESEGNEILYAVATDSTPDYMPEYGGKTVSGISYRINIRVDRSSQVSVEVNPAATPTIEQVEALQEQIDSIDLDALNQQTTEQIQEALKIIGTMDGDLIGTHADVLELTMAVQTLMDADVISSDNVAIELFDTTDDVSVQTGYYDSENKRLWA
jgi:hypothetical protein